jgi:uncharacterized protein YcbK (DUF882 family)
MSLVCRENGQRHKLIARVKRALASSAIVATLAAGAWAGLGSSAMSGGETRTISLYHVHTGEKLTVTYMVNGHYVPSAMKQINHLMRDWRKNQTITIDPKTIDLVWELHADLGSKAPVHIVCGFRSSATNAFLKRSGRNVARKSQHILGKAIDIYFPDVSTLKMRNSALVRQVGGVGYYRSAGGPTGFLHVDSGRVRHWGPGISAREMASIFRDYRKTVGARLNKGDQVMLASAKISAPAKDQAPAANAGADDLADDEMAQLSADSSKAPVTPKAKVLVEPNPEPAVVAEADTAAPAEIVPKPRPKPMEVQMAAAVEAAVNMKIEPASAPPDEATPKADSPVTDNIGTVVAAASMIEETPINKLWSSGTAKGSLAKTLTDGTATDVPVIRTITASAASGDAYWWPGLQVFGTDQDIRRFGAPQPFSESATAGILPGTAEAAEAPALPRLAVASMQEVATGKGDRLVVNREGKGNFGSAAPVKPFKVGQLDQQ